MILLLILDLPSDGSAGADPERELVQRSQRGDPTAFAELIRKYQRWLHAVAVSHLRVVSDAEDIVQDSLVNAWDNLPELRDHTKLRAWLTQIVVHNCRNKERSYTRKMIVFTDLSPEEQKQVDKKLADFVFIEGEELMKQQRLHVLGNIHSLPERYRDVLYLRYLGNCSWEEISRILNLSKKTVEVRLYRGKKLLRKQLKEQDNG